MRQLKNALKSRKNMRNCQERKCILLGLWRCLDELCGCGDGNNNSVNPNIQPSPVPAPAPTPIDPDIIDDDTNNNDNDPDYISLDELNS